MAAMDQLTDGRIRLSDFDFHLPPERIAQHPARPRDAARLLVVGELAADRTVRDLPDLLRPGDLLVVNDTRVIPAQLTAWRGDARIGITLDQPRPDGTWHALARNARRLRRATRCASTAPRILTRGRRGARSRWRRDVAVRPVGRRGLPRPCSRPAPWRCRPISSGRTGRSPRMQQTTRRCSPRATARSPRRPRVCISRPACWPRWRPAASALSPSRCMSAPARSCRCAPMTLRNIACTPSAARSPAAAAAAINAAKAAGGRIVAVGTTSLRLLESAADDAGDGRSRSPARPPVHCPATGSARWIC